jgi:diguanylate cyclase (GGDEF)-like protein
VTLASGHRGFYLAVPVQAHRYSGSLSKAESQSAIVGLIDAQTLAADALGGGTRAFQLHDRLTPLASVGSGLPNALRAAVPVAGRQWTVAVAGGSLSALEIALPWLILAFGFALAAGVAVLLGTAARRRDEALRLAAERLAELEVSLQRVELTNRDLEAAHAEAELRSRVDALTEVFNRRHFGEVLGEELARAGGNTAVLLLDIDHFKQINDGHGHLTGDVILRAVARRTGATLRDTDCLARWGGEEFVILTHVLDREEMLELAERVRRTIADDPVVVDGTPFELRVSIGAVLAGEGIETPDAIIRAADDALYEAKRAGRDRVCLRSGPPSSSAASAMARASAARPSRSTGSPCDTSTRSIGSSMSGRSSRARPGRSTVTRSSQVSGHSCSPPPGAPSTRSPGTRAATAGSHKIVSPAPLKGRCSIPGGTAFQAREVVHL